MFQIIVTDPSKALLARLRDIVPRMARTNLGSMRGDDEQFMLVALTDVAEHCVVDKTRGQTQPHRVNQAIICNSGMLNELLTIVQVEGDVEALAQNRTVVAVVARAFLCLKALARDNEYVQKKVFERFDTILAVPIAEEEKASALREIFKGNKDVCLRLAGGGLHRLMFCVYCVLCALYINMHMCNYVNVRALCADVCVLCWHFSPPFIVRIAVSWYE